MFDDRIYEVNLEKPSTGITTLLFSKDGKGSSKLYVYKHMVGGGGVKPLVHNPYSYCVVIHAKSGQVGPDNM